MAGYLSSARLASQNSARTCCALAINVRFEQSADRVLHLFEFILAALGAIASQSATCEADGSSSILM